MSEILDRLQADPFAWASMTVEGAAQVALELQNESGAEAVFLMIELYDKLAHVESANGPRAEKLRTALTQRSQTDESIVDILLTDRVLRKSPGLVGPIMAKIGTAKATAALVKLARNGMGPAFLALEKIGGPEIFVEMIRLSLDNRNPEWIKRLATVANVSPDQRAAALERVVDGVGIDKDLLLAATSALKGLAEQQCSAASEILTRLKASRWKEVRKAVSRSIALRGTPTSASLDLASERLGRQVRCASTFRVHFGRNPVTAWQFLLFGYLAWVVSWFGRASESSRSGLPSTVLLAVSEDTLFVLDPASKTIIYHGSVWEIILTVRGGSKEMLERGLAGSLRISCTSWSIDLWINNGEDARQLLGGLCRA